MTGDDSARFDLIVVGGGIYGLCLALESARSGLKTLLLERRTFGCATSAKTLRILHGGLRYLQSCDFTRFQDSIRARRWFIQEFPDYVEPFGVLMPLYGRGLRRRSVFRLAMTANNFLSRGINRDLPPRLHIPKSRVLDRDETQRLYPDVVKQQLEGGALWYDAVMLDWKAIILKVVELAQEFGAECLEFVEAKKLMIRNDRVVGLEAVNSQTRAAIIYQSNVVVNCTGPWCRHLAKLFGLDQPNLFYPSLAFNLLLNREPLASVGLAISPPNDATKTLFLTSEGNKILAGTFHARWKKSVQEPNPSQDQIDNFLEDLNQAAPHLNLSQKDVIRVDAGLVPADRPDSPKPRNRPRIVNHQKHGGPKGAFTISGIKFTTARLVAIQTLHIVQSAALN